ncbi:putative mitochondrial group I intron splicing factor CCM1 [[Candida] jaroonii]|uniref:Mitochondrial group I intron splicing factor CCM1 n=1 Tax=[Candida] jaroonii TaxID=467808 RepID=A0ACA9YAI1_9ASCO|nr:putative mitochondrial group I intron splicing factor CCM1 [[Candida] jaroonii]
MRISRGYRYLKSSSLLQANSARRSIKPYLIPLQRNYSWFSSKARSDIIIEEPTESNEKLDSIKDTLRNTDIPVKLRRKILSQKLEQFTELNEEELPILDKLFIETYKLHDYDITLMDTNQIISLTENICEYLVEQESFKIPEFLSVIVMSIFQGKIAVDDNLLINVVKLSSRSQNGDLLDTLKLLSKSNLKVNSEFPGLLIESSDPTIELFEVMSEEFDVDSRFYQLYIAFIEKLFRVTPKVHELDFSRSLLRVQDVSNNLVSNCNFKQLDIEVILNLLKMLYDLNLANYSVITQALIDSIVQHLEKEDLTGVFMRQNNEDLINDTLKVLMSKKSPILRTLFKSVIENPIFYSQELTLQAKFFLDEVTVEEILSSDIDLNNMYLKLVELITLSEKSVELNDLTKKFNNEGLETPLMAYKLQLDQSITHKDFQKSIQIFESSVSQFTQWSEETNPQVLKTLNDLIILSCTEPIEKTFEIFTNVKQQMVNFPVNIHTINAICKKMLESEFVGDTIELLKRELPDIKKDDIIKLPIEYSFGEPYKELFTILHDFVISYTGESTYETNWVLYGELHKYFHVPYDTHLPTMKFFNDHNRLDSSLVIFRQVKKLNELHGKHNHLPPSKDMYLYLFQEFGDKLYEEGVNEIHEYLKMDIALPRQDLELQNALLNAYSNLQDVAKARDLFSTMLPTRQLQSGINEETVKIMIKTYTYSDLNYVISFWNNMSTYGILPNYDIFRQYLIAHVYHGFAEDAIELTNEMDDYGLEFTKDTLVSMYNFCLRSDKQDVIEKWAKDHHSEVWKEAEGEGLLKRSDDYEPDNLLAEGKQEIASVN